MKWAKIAAIGNSFSAILFTLIFFYFNKMVLDKDSKENSIYLLLYRSHEIFKGEVILRNKNKE